MKIRKANKDDNFALLILKASKPLFLSYGIEPLETVVDLLTKNKNNKFSYQNALVIEHKQKIIGVLVGYEAKNEKFLAENQAKIIKQTFQKAVFVANNEAIKDTFYIDSVAISDQYQGQGYGTKLIEKIIEKNPKVSLICEVENQKALQLYQKIGFKTETKINLFNQTYYQMKYEK